jgi:Family of unknown function (DUF5681)
MTATTPKTSQRKRIASQPRSSIADYCVGPGRPPREYQFKPGQSGNPAGARKRPPSIAPDLKALLQTALGKKVTLTIGDKERILTKAAAGIEQLVDQFARGDRYARRDLFDLADKLGLDLGASSKAALEELTGKALAAEDEALVADFVRRKTGKSAGNDDAHPARDNLAESLTMKGCSRDET